MQQPETTNSNVTCPICKEALIVPDKEVWATKCGHVFHYPCLARWLTKSITCPQCRQLTFKGSIRKLYFPSSDSPTNILENKDAQVVMDSIKRHIVSVGHRLDDLESSIARNQQGLANSHIMTRSLRKYGTRHKKQWEPIKLMIVELRKQNAALGEKVLEAKRVLKISGGQRTRLTRSNVKAEKD